MEQGIKMIDVENLSFSYDDIEYLEDVFYDFTDLTYLGDGWYQDGDSGQKDYYISFAIHFYSLF